MLLILFTALLAVIVTGFVYIDNRLRDIYRRILNDTDKFKLK